jgi:flagellar basal body rod protein FlgB
MGLFSDVTSIEKMLDFQVTRHGVLLSNLSNADTQGYQTKDLKWVSDETLFVGINKTNERHIKTEETKIQGEIEYGNKQADAESGGKRIETALAQITGNRLRYELSLEMAKRKLALLQLAVTGGGV